MARPTKLTPERQEPVYIYALADPRDSSIRYVGKSATPNTRYEQHLVDRTSNRYKTDWIQSLLGSGNRPRLEILETVDPSDWIEAEHHWLGLGYQRGWPLVNIKGFAANAFSSVLIDEELDEVLWYYLPDDLWNRFCGFDQDRKKAIIQAVALHMLQLSCVAIRSRGMFDFMVDSEEEYRRGLEKAAELVVLEGARYTEAMHRIDVEANAMIARNDKYISHLFHDGR